MSGEAISQRQETMKSKLLEFTKQQHDQFLRDKNIEITFDPFEAQMWHSEFDPHSAKPVPKAQIDNPPVTNTSRVDSLKDTSLSLLNVSRYSFTNAALHKTQ